MTAAHAPITSAQVFSRGALVGSVQSHARTVAPDVQNWWGWCHECDFKSTWHHDGTDALLALAQHLRDAHWGGEDQ